MSRWLEDLLHLGLAATTLAVGYGIILVLSRSSKPGGDE